VEGAVMSYADFARAELKKWLKGDKYARAAAKDVLELLETFSGQGHSGMSAPVIVEMFRKLALFRPLGPLTGEDGEWNDVGDELQNRRRSSVFKDKKTGIVRDIDAVVFQDEDGVRYTCQASMEMGEIRFPYEVPDRPRIVKVRDGRPVQ
jgi:hypothetical protein